MKCHWCGKALRRDAVGTLVDSTGGDACGTRAAQDRTTDGWPNPPHVPAVGESDRRDAKNQIRDLVVQPTAAGLDVLLDFLTPDQVRQLAEDYRE